MSTMHLAQINIGRMIAPLDTPAMHGFISRLAELNALAEASPGFVWRMKDESGDGNTYLRPFDDERMIVNMSAWESIEQLRAYTYDTAHATMLQQRREWFEWIDRTILALWWIPVGHIPTIEDAKKRLASLDVNGPTPFAFTFKYIPAVGAVAGRVGYGSDGTVTRERSVRAAPAEMRAGQGVAPPPTPRRRSSRAAA